MQNLLFIELYYFVFLFADTVLEPWIERLV